MLSTLVLATLLAPADARTPLPRGIDSVIENVESLVWDQHSQSMAQRHGLSLVNVTWEDTARTKESVWGPNISDMTIGVRDSNGQLHPMPVLRFDNYTDETVDIAADRFVLPTGNEDGEALSPVTLADMLKDTRKYLSDPGSWAGDDRGLWNKRDTDVIVSAQAALLPVPKEGQATFTPVIYNYQSMPGHPAVAVIVATREGTSIQIVENDEGYMSDVLWFNDDGERAPFTATRLSDHLAGTAPGSGSDSGPIAASGGADGANVVLVIQVPLKQTAMPRLQSLGYLEDAAAPAMAMAEEAERSDIENAVIGHGPVEGPFAEIGGLEIERDPRFPVRVTVQLYKATTTGRLTDADVADLRAEIDQIYGDPAYVSSLVVDGNTGRKTEWVEQPQETASWARPAWQWLKAF